MSQTTPQREATLARLRFLAPYILAEAHHDQEQPSQEQPRPFARPLLESHQRWGQLAHINRIVTIDRRRHP